MKIYKFVGKSILYSACIALIFTFLGFYGKMASSLEYVKEHISTVGPILYCAYFLIHQFINRIYKNFIYFFLYILKQS
jgi:hypothetical protein